MYIESLIEIENLLIEKIKVTNGEEKEKYVRILKDLIKNN